MSDLPPPELPAAAPPPTGVTAPGEGRLADGEWHRLHPATPLLRGGIAFVAILGVIIVNLRDIVIDIVFGGPDFEDDYNPVTFILEHDYLGFVALAIIVGLILTIGAFWLSWRMHTFRITDQLVEVRSGILFRTHRRGRLDRIQGINIVRPFLARLVGAAKLEVSVAGEDANIQLAYLGSSAADELRREILLLASGTRAGTDASPPVEPASGSLVANRVGDLLAPELDPTLAPPESVVKLHPARLVGSLLLSVGTIIAIVAVVLIIVFAVRLESGFFIFGLVPAAIAFGSYNISRFTRSLRYSIASTPDGVRVGFGLLSTSNDTLPPGRIHAVMVSQPLLWRLTGWWEIKINRASSSSAQGAAGQANTTILPVGTVGDVRKVLELVLPGMVDDIDLLERALVSRGGDDGFKNSPRRAAIVRWFSWRRNGLAQTSSAVLLRRGAIWRELVIVPKARIQSVALSRGPLGRRLRLAKVRVHTVAGPVSAYVGAVDQATAVGFFESLAHEAVAAGQADRSHRWRDEGQA